MRSSFKLPLGLLLILAIAMAGCVNKRGHSDTSQMAEKPKIAVTATPVTVATITPIDLEEKVEVTGTLRPLNDAVVGNRLAGRVAAILVREGSPVKKGQLVAQLENQDNQAQVASATAALAGAKARLEQAKAAVTQQLTSTDSGILVAQAAVEAATAHLEQAKAAVSQQKTATTSGIQTATAALDAAMARLNQARTTADSTDATVKAAVKASDASLDAAKSRLTVLKKGSRTQELAVAENQVRVAQTTFDKDKDDYQRYKNLFDNGAVARTIMSSAEAKMNVSKAQLDSANQQLSLAKEGPRAEDIEASEAVVRQAEEGLASAKANLTQVDVAKANVRIAETGVEQAKAAVDSAKAGQQQDIMRDKDVLAAEAAIRQAKANLASARSAHQVNIMRDKDVLAAEAGVQQAKEALTTARNGLDYTYIVSPVDGVVAEKLVEVGQSLAASIPMLKISTNNSLYFEASISELVAARLHAGQMVKLAVDALQGDRTNIYHSGKLNEITGIVERVIPVVDAKTRNFRVRVTVQRSASLYPGMFARGSVVVARHPGTLAVPKDALVEKDNQQVLFTAVGTTARKRIVQLGASDDKGMVQILAGVTGGEQVITVGQQSLQDGDPISVVK